MMVILELMYYVSYARLIFLPSAEIDTVMSDDDDDDDEMSPTVMVNGKPIGILLVNDEIIAQMTAAEKESYISAYQEYYSHIYE